MYSLGQNKNKVKAPASQSIKKQRPRPQWTTDFVDREQFKLSQTQMIQKKAALQSKHREEAKRQLQQRRKKLQMGIIDDQTRKVYETALISKKIDINPPIRKNLTEMIRYEKQQKQKRLQNQQDEDEEIYDEQDEIDQYEKEIREAQNFIKKFQKAKKQEKIERAVQILSNKRPQGIEKEKKQSQSDTRINNFMNAQSSVNSRNERSLKKQKGLQASKGINQDDALSSIEDTIRFMEEKLFAAKKTVEQHSKSFISEQDSKDLSQLYEKKSNKFSDDEQVIFPTQKATFKKQTKPQKEIKQVEVNYKTKQNFIQKDDQELQFDNRIAQISQLRIQLKEEDGSQDDECLNTIRRMREMMDSKEENDQKKYSERLKENIRDNTCRSVDSFGLNLTSNKKAHQSGLQSDAELSFSLTANNDDQYQHDNSLLNLSKSKIKAVNFSTKNISNFIEKNNFFKPAPPTTGDFSKKRNKQDEYEDQYQKIKQNLFKCINSGENEVKAQPIKQISNKQKTKIFQKFQQDSDQQSQDSLMVRDKINLWKQELQHQKEPEDDDQDNEQSFVNTNTNTSSNLKTTYMNINPKFTRISQQVITQSPDKFNEDEEDDDDSYKFNYFEQNNRQPLTLTQQLSRFNGDETNSQFMFNTNASSNGFGGMKKPPTQKKNQQNTEKFEEMKKMIFNTTNQIQKIEIQPLKIEPLGGNGQMLGFDFRGSINIKKNVLQK